MYQNFETMLKFTIFAVLSIFVKLGKLQHVDGSMYGDDFLQSSDQMLRKFWGIQDVTTSVGKLFHYKVPNDAFKGTILYYDVVGEENAALPKWMIYDKKTAVIEGVPSINDIGDTRINVKAYDNKGQSVGDMFVVEVYPLWETNTNNKRKCKKGEGVMMITLVINENFDKITPRRKINALKNLARYLHLHVNTLLFLNSQGNLENDSDMAVFDSHVGNKEQNTSVITWQIGCKEKIWAEKLQIVELVEKYVKDGTLAERLQLPVLRWQIASSFNPFRTRRHAGQDDNHLHDDDKDDADGLDDEGGDEEDVDDDLELDDDAGQNDNILLNSASPVPSPTNTRLPVIGTSSPISNKKLIVDSAISNQTFSNLNNIGIIPNSTLSTSSEQTDAEDATEAILEDDLNDNDYHKLSSNGSSNADDEGTQVNLALFTSFTSTSTANLDKTTAQTPNRYPPQVKRNMEQIVVEAGKPLKIPIPEDIFVDAEDGNTRNLSLKLLKPDDCVVYAPWIELTEVQELQIFASLDTISKHEITLTAIDSDNMSVNTTILVNVQHPQNARTINFEVSLHMKLHDGQHLTVASLFNVLDELVRLYNDGNYSKITVRNVTCNPFVLTWANITLPTAHCDNKTISNLLDVLTKSPGSMDVKKEIYLDFDTNINIVIEKITWLGIGLCNEIPPPRLPMPEKQNFQPVIHNRIDNITATVGELTVFKVPENTFFDADEPNSRNLKLNLFTIDYTPIPPGNWLQFDSTNQEFYGLPMASDVGSVKYQLVCNDNKEDSEDMKARHVIEIVVEPATKAYYNVEFRMKLTKSYDDFNKSPLLKRTFVEKVAKLFGDKNTSSIVISEYSPGSLKITWHNKSLPFFSCDEAEITKLRKILLTDDMKLEDNVNEVLKPEFEAILVEILPIGICEGDLTHVHTDSPEVNTGSQEIHAIIFDNVYFINSILPIVIIIIMIFVASIIACILYRRQRSTAKWTLGDDEKRTYRSKGIPVIFQDELEERLEPTNKSPIILKEEKPPLPPPDYQKVPPVATTALLSDFDDSAHQQGIGTYSRSTERNGRSKQTPTYRKPPPYVPQ